MLQAHRSWSSTLNGDLGIRLQSLSYLSDHEDGANSLKPRKRKHSDIDGRFQLGRQIVVQPHPSLPSPQAKHLTPILLISRSCLPLAYLDLSCKAEDFGPRFISASIEILETGVSGESLSEPIVLIAQSANSDHLWAVEKAREGIYALCKLNTSVELKALKQLQLSSGFAQSIQYIQQAQQSLDQDWWRSAVIDPKLEVDSKVSRHEDGKEIQQFQLDLRKPMEGRLPQSPGAKQQSQREVRKMEDTSPILTSGTSQESEEVFDMIRLQYQEALYAPQIPLAYFAKGPLSRARATFYAHDGSLRDQSLLVQFLRSSILTLSTMDLKYRETLPGLIRDLPFGTFSGDESASVVNAFSKKLRKPKKSKIGKNGLYAGEEVRIMRWWLGKDKSSMASESTDGREETLKSIMLEQRVKETQLQLILVLEALALEASANSSSHLIPGEATTDKCESVLRKPSKSKKPQDLNTLVDLLVDRLCIWQSMSTVESKSTNAKNIDTDDRAIIQNKAAQNDALRDFCKVVILPFYGARLTKLATILCQKFGGPKDPSPIRPVMARATTSRRTQRTEGPSHREQAHRPRRTLERVLTDERSISQRPPLLSRSATEPSLPRIKREQSETSLSALPLNRVAMHKRYSQREVDLHDASQVNESKLKQKAKVERELQNAIAALKKPNPRMAVKELVEDAERRVATSRSRKSKNPIRNPFAQGVQIMATPSKNRRNGVFAHLRPFPTTLASEGASIEADEIPSSSASKITDSARKETSTDRTLDRSRLISGRDLATVEQTPTRGPSKLTGRPPNSMTSLEAAHNHPSQSCGTTEPESAKPTNKQSTLKMTQCSSNIQHTPVKVRSFSPGHGSREGVIQSTPNKPTQCKVGSGAGPLPDLIPSAPEQTPSIYAALGWDDDLDELS